MGRPQRPMGRLYKETADRLLPRRNVGRLTFEELEGICLSIGDRGTLRSIQGVFAIEDQERFLAETSH